MTDSVDALASRLQAEGEAMQVFFRGLGPQAWQQTIYGEGGPWNVRDVLAHLIASEQGFQQLLQNVAAGGSGVPPEFDIDGYNNQSVRVMREQDVSVLLAQYAMVRERTVALVRALLPDQLVHRGRHPYLGEITLGEMLRAIYHHNSLHLRDVRRALRDAQLEPRDAQSPSGAAE